MKKRSNEENNLISLTEEEFFKMITKEQSLKTSSFEDPALEKFVKEPVESNLHKEESIITSVKFFSLIFLILVILISSIISQIRGSMEAYLAIPIIILSIFALILLISDRIMNKKSK